MSLSAGQVFINWTVITWIGDCLSMGKLSQYRTNVKVNSAFYLSGVGKMSTGLPGLG